MWEVFTCGKMPYGRLKNSEVVERVQKGMILEKPKACYKEVYDVSILKVVLCTGHFPCLDSSLIYFVMEFLLQVMRKCWAHLPENRPSFKVLKETLVNVSQGILVDWLAKLVCECVSHSPSSSSGVSTSDYEQTWLNVCQTLCREAKKSRVKKLWTVCCHLLETDDDNNKNSNNKNKTLLYEYIISDKIMNQI